MPPKGSKRKQAGAKRGGSKPASKRKTGRKAAAAKTKQVSPAPSESPSESSNEESSAAEELDTRGASRAERASFRKIVAKLESRLTEAKSSVDFDGTRANRADLLACEKVVRSIGSRIPSLSSATRSQIDEFKEDLQAILDRFFLDGVMTNDDKTDIARLAAEKIADASSRETESIIIETLSDLQGKLAERNIGMLHDIATVTKDFLPSVLAKARPGGGSGGYNAGGSSREHGNCNFCHLPGHWADQCPIKRGGYSRTDRDRDRRGGSRDRDRRYSGSSSSRR